MKPSLVAAFGAGLALPGLGLLFCCGRVMRAARARPAAEDRHVISTPWGAVEYAERGAGAPVLVIHGIYHRVDGLLCDLFPDRRVIAPSRFGYLGSRMPPNATPAAQADAFAALLDALALPRLTLSRSQPVPPRRCNSRCGIPRQ